MLRAAKTPRWPLKAWVLLLCLVSSIFFVLFQGGKLSLMLLIIVSTLTVYLSLGRWSGIASTRGKRDIYGVTGGAALQSGTALKVAIRVAIPGIWPIPYVTVKDRLIRRDGNIQLFEGTFVPDWRRNGMLEYVTPPLARGFYRFEEVECVTADIFGLFEHKGMVPMPLAFSVLPRTIAIPEWRHLHQLFKGSHQQSASGGSQRETTQINGVREYIYGDRLAKIHWNATARTGTWKSKEFERESLPKLMIVLDRNPSGYRSKDGFELAVSTAASLADFAISRGMSVGLLSAGGGKTFWEPPGGYEAKKRIEQHLIEVQPDASQDVMKLISDRTKLPSGGCVVAVVSPLRNDSMLRTFQWLHAYGTGAAHMWVNAEQAVKVREDWTRLLRGIGTPAYSIQRLEDLPSALRGREA
ncbi:DUF58 domain-containing protein [Paenibacillus thermotolerans]|uniref:DUF58 domain-containing protein n=1 Tax=Paenibacillus thermotolerans TaxID=3027807 RepID=UPI0023687C61|nr:MULTISPECIES: DUF58 domain-containing protein [unclassified Paenibacillus]